MDSEQFEQFLKMQENMIKSLVSNLSSSTKQSTENQIYVPNFETFDPIKENFTNYKQRFQNYVEMKNISSNKEYCAKLLLNSIGPSNFNLVSTLTAPKNPSELNYDDLVKILEEQLVPKRNVLVSQHKFLSIYQTEQQSISEFVTNLRSNISNCEFTSPCECEISIADIFLRAQFIRGIKDNSIREQILQSDKLEFKDVVSKAIALETSKIDSKLIAQKHVPNTSPVVPDINKVSQATNHSKERISRSQSQQRGFNQPKFRNQSKSRINYDKLGINGLCLHCGRSNHLAKECRTDKNQLKCSACSKHGHVSKVCITTLLSKQSESSKQSTNQINETPINQYGIQNVVDVYQTEQCEDTERFYAHVNIEGTPVTFEVDSGSGHTFLPQNMFKKLNLNLTLQSTNKTFKSYTQDVFKPYGKVEVNVSYRSKAFIGVIFIVPDDYPPILGRVWIRNLKIDLHEVETQQYTSHLINTINDNNLASVFPVIFEQKIGCVPNYKVSLKLREDAKPVYYRERDVPYALREKVDLELDSLEAEGIITKIDASDWGSPLVIIPKADGGVRLCVDYKVGVNERLTNSHYPIKKTEDLLNSLRNSKYFCRLDLYKAYLHILVDEPSSKIQTITTHRGTFRMNRLSFGIKTAPAEFNRIIDQILRDVPKTEYYFDDIVVHGSTIEECKSNLYTCLNQLQKFDLHLNREKCSFFQERIEFLGHVVEHNRILKSPAKVNAILKINHPTSIEEVRRFLGMVTYYSRFIPNLSTLTAPLRQLLVKNTKFHWNEKCSKAFDQLKMEIASERVLTPFDPTLPVQLACDASPQGVAGILSHIIDGQERPIAFASRSLTQAEQNYSQLDREALAIIFSVGHFHQYLFARPFKLITDNRPLVRIFHQNAKIPLMTSARLQRYAAFLSGFNYEVVYKKGIENSNVDCLSRAPIDLTPQAEHSINIEVNQICDTVIEAISTLDLTYETLRDETRKDPNLSKLLKELHQDRLQDSEFTISSNIVFRGSRAVIPASLQESILKELHHTHIGSTKMKQLARRYVYWKSIDRDIERVVRECKSCASTRNSPPKAPLHPWEEPENNWQRIHIDYAGPFQNHNFLVIMDAKSKWAEIEVCTTAPTSTTTIEMLQNVFSRFGFPDVIVSDNAAIFTSEIFQQFCKEGGIFQKFIAPGHPATNGLAERNVQTLKHRLATMVEEPYTMKQKIREILFRYRATPLANGKTPSELFLHRQIRIKLDALKPSHVQKSSIRQSKARQYKVGDRVQARYYSNNKNHWKPGKIIKKYGFLHYLIRLDSGYVFKRHIDQLQLFGTPRKTVAIPPTPTIQENDQTCTTPRQELNDEPRQRLPIEDMVSIPNIIPENEQVQHETGNEGPVLRRSTRTHRQPEYLRDYVSS